MSPVLLTFDVFGTVLDWRRGLRDAVRATTGRAPDDATFDRIVDAQGAMEQATPFRTYAAITATSLVETLGMDNAEAESIGRDVGRWPLYDDSAAALRALSRIAPCVAMTNSDHAHGVQVRESLGFALARWIPAEEVRVYKPSPGFWRATSGLLGVSFGRAWWHVSAYADYDLAVAKELGLTTVFVQRPHARPPAGERADVVVRDLADLAARLGAA